MLFRKKKVNKPSIQEDLDKFNYDHLEILLKQFEDRPIHITMIDGTRIDIPTVTETKSSRFGRFES